MSWWKGGVIYQIYPRSYQDSNHDGIGDLKGITERLYYVASLGVDAIWISPFFKSPMKDFGYDVADYRAVDPIFGSIDDFKALVDRAHSLNIKVMIDQVWSHTSDQHEWFKESRKDRTNAKQDWYIWADPKPDGTEPNNWISYFGGRAWTWDARRRQYYLNHFLKEQPTLNLWNPDVRQAILETAGFWFDMGVDGFRLDVAHCYLSDKELRDNPARPKDAPWPSDIPSSNPMAYQLRTNSMSRPENIEWIETLRQYSDRWPDRALLGETGGEDCEKTAALYVQTDKRFHLAYSFGLVGSHMDKASVSNAIKQVEDTIGDGWICWATSNHDFKRPVSRMNPPANLVSEAALLNMALGLSLRGTYCMYQGEELGLPQADLAFDDLVDPYDRMLYPDHVGRDGCRTPIPWYKDQPHGGFSTAKPWLPVQQPHKDRAVDVQEAQTDSVLAHYRRFLAWRKKHPAIALGDIKQLDLPDPVMGFERTEGQEKILCLFNMSPDHATHSLHVKATVLDDIDQKAVLNGQDVTFAPYGYIFLKV